MVVQSTGYGHVCSFISVLISQYIHLKWDARSFWDLIVIRRLKDNYFQEIMTHEISYFCKNIK